MQIKSYTDLKQSKVLAEILPLESADMHYARVKDEEYDWIPLLSPIPKLCAECIENIPCWSLSALLNVLPDELGDNHFLTLSKEEAEYCCCYEDINGNSFRHEFGDNPIDACYEMILKLNELNLL